MSFSARHLRLPLLGLLLAAAAGVCALVPVVNKADLVPTESQTRATELITDFIANYHYKKVPLDDALSRQIFDRYLDSLDPNHSYFLDSDIKEFSPARDQLDDQLREARLDTAFAIFIRFRDRLDERTRAELELLNRPMDFTVNEDYVFDRSKSPWAGRAELDEYWRKRVKNDVLSLRLSGKTSMDDIKKILTRRYEDMQRRMDQLNSEDVFELFINAYLTAIEPHTAYFSPRTSENFRIRMSLSLEGIGAVLQSDNEYTQVRQILKGGPADKSGLLHEDDRITGVGQGATEPIVDVVGWRLDDVVDLIRGKKGSTVRLQVLPKGAGPGGPTRTITLVRNKIELEDEAAKKSVIEVADGGRKIKIGVINLPTFYQDFEARARGDKNYRSTTRDVRKLINELTAAGIDGLLIDLRGNGGGSLSEATELTGLFIGSGPVVQVKSADGSLHVERADDPGIAYGGPLAVLVDGNSASASEIFADAIQDYRRGVIIGEPTFGKGTVQNLVDLDQYDRKNAGHLGQLKATIAQFFRINGDSTQHRGVLPDVPFPPELETVEDGERSLPNALPWAHIDPANFVAAQAPVGAYASERSRHEQRLQEDRAFQLLLEQDKAVREARARTRLSLVESVRRQEQERTQQELKQREAAFRAATGQPPPPPDEDKTDDDGADNPPRKDAAKPVDIVLNEAAHVLSDLIVPTPQQAGSGVPRNGLATHAD